MSRLGVLHSDEELTGTDEIVDESLPELRQLRMIPCTIMYHLDDFMNRGAGRGMDNQVSQYPCVNQRMATGCDRIFKLETNVICTNIIRIQAIRDPCDGGKCSGRHDGKR